MKFIKQFPTYFLLCSVIFFSLLMLKLTLPYFSFKNDVDFLLTKQAVLHIKLWRIAFYTHISTSLIVLLFGGFQFVKFLIRNKPKVHRLLGKIYVILVLAISAPSGLIMAFYANGGILAKTSFITISILWWYFTFVAYKNAKDKNFELHQANMYRSYALTLSAISLRIYVLTLPHFIHLSAKEMYILVAWLSWIPNLIIAEVLIRNKRNKFF